ncbi:hypothetical protein [Robertmurraya korlensis]|uniref:hypothetical protein n=1 Tax=Robertmurraya korlensis TaxID=519977 RepID=UPI00082421E9|nr:hypothetical protein [Robertmurraya korlensis]
MKKIFKIILGILGLVLVGIAVLAISFNISMKPDKEKEREIRALAEQYLEENFNDNFEIYDTLFDNMGNFEFEYAAKGRDKGNQTEFLVYRDSETNEMIDTYVADKWADDLEKEIRSYITDRLGEKADYYVFFPDEIGNELGIDPNKVESYKDYDVAATIRITLPREKNKNDDTLFNEFVTYIVNYEKLQQGTVTVGYIAENGVILEEEEWSKDF